MVFQHIYRQGKKETTLHCHTYSDCPELLAGPLLLVPDHSKREETILTHQVRMTEK